MNSKEIIVFCYIGSLMKLQYMYNLEGWIAEFYNYQWWINVFLGCNFIGFGTYYSLITPYYTGVIVLCQLLPIMLG